ncbi:MAG: extracellular solute-binding protein, partial [Firmicutes bacterium]|nr:extracellular solute-binding protein [Bacillota bacterium]
MIIPVGAAADDAIKLTYYSTSAEVNSMFEEMFVRYHELNPNVTLELIPTGVGQGQQEQLQSLYASGNAPTFMNIDPANVLDYQDKLYIFDPATEWFQNYNDGALEAGKFSGEIYGIPFSTQGYGLCYNKRVVESVIPDFDPATINTQDALKAFFETLDAAGVAPTMLHGANWSMGAHYLGLVYAVHGPATAE